MPQVQWEQHQPLKSASSIQIKRLLIDLPLCCGFQRGRGGWDTTNGSSAEAELVPARRIFCTVLQSGKVPKGLRPVSDVCLLGRIILVMARRRMLCARPSYWHWLRCS